MFRREYIETEFKGYPSITHRLVEMVEESGIQEGVCVVNAPELTTALCITSFWDKRGLDDLMDEIDRNFPARVNYKSLFLCIRQWNQRGTLPYLSTSFYCRSPSV